MTSAIARKHDAATGMYECTSCLAMKPRADFSRHKTALYGLSPVCRVCDRVRHQKRWAETREAQRVKRAALAPVAVTPKPKPKPEQRPLYKAGTLKPTTPDSVRFRSANPIVYPVDPIERCVHPGMACGAQEGFALAHDLFSANVAMGCVRGYFATVGKDAESLVYPRFARKESAALWTAMIRSRCGVRDERREAA